MVTKLNCKVQEYFFLEKKKRIDTKNVCTVFLGGYVEITEYDKSEYCFLGQNGIWVKFQHFMPKDNGEKWSRKNIFEIPPSAQ